MLNRIFEERYSPELDVIEFTLDDVRKAVAALKLKGRRGGKNAPDIIYRMRSRTVLPARILEAGFSILRATNRGKYRLEKAESTLVAIPPNKPVDALDLTPLPVRRLLPEALADIDEQGLLTIVAYSKILDHFTGLTVYRLRSHVRKSVEGVGQAEIDQVDVGVALRDDEVPIVIPIEAKAADEPVNRVQIVYQVAYAHEYFPGHEVRPICIKVDGDSLVHCLEFNVTEKASELKVARSATYRLTVSDQVLGIIRAREAVAQKHVEEKNGNGGAGS